MPEQSLALVAALLRRGRELDRLSAALTLLAIGLGLYQSLQGSGWRYFAPLMLVVAMLGLWQKYWALRVALDAELFERFSRAGAALEAQTRELDQALAGLGLARVDAAGRSWKQRSEGALRLLRWQAVACAVQFLLALACLLSIPLLNAQT
ncbi:hypothetical protein ABZR71_04650 [Pseudomonas paraeruginosa]|uniref:Transmembrane protein n=1 Tax=Pseudomonas paraeruginosa TaxID=2994495 RepID=A0A2R3IWZ0_9PSED|nr:MULTISPECIES: hypothetical protein [Pseudomonas aeruginosa group]AVK06137.1 hypothetical protein CSB93_3981 [Pseudomonas paraeruginosa]AWE91625.1 hypothetical protein CSC28_2764 [Pseudomonas paraeruginosa]KAB0749080.1 hypothetical protein F7O94_08380 [Pseudomonas aeruginosa]KSD62154.1 hypothetical protein AO903_30690 [Pseudomonas aeruginosa]KSF81799.1 hypothetical protein AO940_00375 [Pseudomonas aeruginosa]